MADPSKFAASDYQITMTGATAGTITRMSDGQQVANFATFPVTFDGLTLTTTGGTAQAGDRFYLKPFSDSASNIAREFSTPRALAVASPVVGQMGANNKGSLQLTSLVPRSNPASNVPVTITFTGPGTYTRSDDLTNTPQTYTSGQAIEGSFPATNPLTQWTLKLQGAPKAGDTFTVRAVTDPAAKVDPSLNGGNALAMMGLRDAAMFDGATMTDGYASLISQIGIRSQSANYSAEVSSNIAINAEQNRTGVSGVNLDEEAGKLLQYQQAYQASAKMIQVAQSIFDTLVQTIMR
jgi:flagellar hook-associated protein 1 FlgK